MNFDHTKTIFIECAYTDKDKVKFLGGKWDKLNKMWTFQVDEDFNDTTYNGYNVVEPKTKIEQLHKHHLTLTLDVPYKDRERAKLLNCKWHSLIKKWSIAINDLEFDEPEWNGFKVVERNHGYYTML